MASILELKNVSKTMGKKKAVDNVSFTVNSGEIFGFLGPNGAGKTTTIKMITGLLSIDEGEIFIGGKNVKNDFEGALKNVGGIIENPEMYGYLSGKDNLNIYGKMHGTVSKDRIDETVKMVKLENRINDKVKKYSLGMRQRLGVAQALLHKPKLLILDEPTNGLDPVGIKELRDNLRELAENEGLAVLVSSHLLSEMELMCDRVGIIDNGKIIDIRSLKDIKKKSKDVNLYSLDVSDIDKSIKVITDDYKDMKVEKQDEKLRLNCSREEIAKINKLLINEDILVYEMAINSKTLEEEFMEVTKGSKDQIS